MKKILYILPLLAAMTACEDQLNKVPQDAVSSGTFFQDAAQLQQYSNQFYTILPSAASMYGEVSDEIACTLLPDEARGTRVIPADASSSSWSWGMLRHINYMLEHVKQCKDPVAANEYAALARFFRAYFYYDKVRHFGDVPWYDHTMGSASEELYKARDKRWVVMQNVVADLNFAIENMSSDKSNVFLANRYAAMALKSRVCLFEGTFCKYHKIQAPDVNGVPYWKYMLNEAAAAAKLLIDSHQYAIYKVGSQPYRDLFTTVDVQSCSEYIMARGYNAALGLKHNATGYTTSPTTGKPGFTKRFVNQYLCSDGQRFTEKFYDTYQTMGMGEEMDGRDPRMEQTMFCPYRYIRVGKTKPEEYSVTVSATGYQLIKYVMDESTSTYNNSDCDMPLFRIAEVYLNYAEALAELESTENNAEIDMAINAVRDRVNMHHIKCDTVKNNPCKFMESLYPNVSQVNKAIILEVRRERDIELVEEGFRYWDLMRWKEGKAFEQPYLGIAFKGVSKSEDDQSGFVDIDNDGYDDICAWVKEIPFAFGVDFFEVGKDIILSKGTDGGCILNNGTPDNLNNGRVWREDRDYLYPIPIRERVLSNGVLTQNPGWDDGLTF